MIYFGWKVVKKTSFIKPEDMDFHTGLAEVEAHENSLNFRAPASRYERYCLHSPAEICHTNFPRIMDWLW